MKWDADQLMEVWNNIEYCKKELEKIQTEFSNNLDLMIETQEDFEEIKGLISKLSRKLKNVS